MIYVDDREGSGDLVSPLQRLGVGAETLRMDFGDVAWLGNGPEGSHTVSCGVEIKKIRDLMTSIQDGRLSGHQLPGLCRQYDVRYLLVEGWWRPGPEGILEIGKEVIDKPDFTGIKWFPLEFGRRRYLYQEVDKALNSMAIKAGVYLILTDTRHETAWAIRDLYSWWTDKEWEEHRSHLGLHRVEDTALLVPPSLRRRVAQELPGVGHQKSATVAAYFKTTWDMVNADEKAWREIAGIGKTLATRIVTMIRGE